MKRHLNTSYRLVWNHITGTLVVASELARSRGKRTGVAIALSLAAVTSVPVLAADTVVQAGETVSGGTLTNHDNQIVFGTANGMTISTGLEYGPDNEANTGGQWIQNGGTANNTTVTGGGLQRVNAGGSVSDTVISAGGGQSLQGQAVNTTLNGGEQWVHEGGIATGTVINEKGWQAVKSGAVATDTVVNTGAEGGPDAENGDTGQFVRGNAVRTTINKNGRQIVAAEGTANTTVVYAGGDQTVHGHALDTTLNGGYQYVHNGGTASGTVVNSDGWQVVKDGAVAENTTVNQKGKLQVNAGGTATHVTLKQGGALVTSTAATVLGSNRLGNFTVENGKADGVVLESGGRLDVLEGHSAQKTRMDDGGNRVCQVLTCLPEKFVVDFANGIDVAQEHIRTAGERTFFRRLKEGLTGEGAARQNAINASLAQGVEASLRWLTEMTTSLATTNYAITRVNDRVSSLVSDTARLAHYSADTREQLLTLADQVHHKLNHLEEKLHRVDQVQRAQLHLEQIFSWWSAGRYASFSPAGRCYVALEELRWGAFGDVIRQGETGQVNQLLDILRHKALTQMAQESGGSATVRLNTLDWLGGQGREQADNEWHDAINWLGDWCSEEQHPVIWSTTQAAEHLPVRMPRLCSAERLSESMVDEIFQKGAA